MITSMTGYSKSEVAENGIKAIVEIKSVNGRFLEISVKSPRSLSFKEFEIRDIVKKNLSRGTVSIYINIESEQKENALNLDLELAENTYHTLVALKKRIKVKEAVKLQDVLTFSSNLVKKDNTDNSNDEWEVTKKSLTTAIRNLNRMRIREGNEIGRDITKRLKNVQSIVEKIERMGIDKIPAERERLRLRVAQLFESDEIDEHRLQTELVMLADKLDISEECVRLKSHMTFFYEALDSKDSEGRKINFLLQEMHREINTIGSKANDAAISHLVVAVKEDLERIREQIQNAE